MPQFHRSSVWIALGLAACAGIPGARAQARSFTVTLDTPVHGTVQLSPPLPPGGGYPAGTVVTVRGVPDKGYVLDSAW